MAKITAEIRIQTSEFAPIKALLEEHLGIRDIEDVNSVAYGINISALDCSYEVEYAASFKNEKGIIEMNPLDSHYLNNESKIVVFVTINPFSLITECLPALAGGIASFISRKTKFKCAIFIEELPLCVYENGRKIVEIQDSYDLYNKRYLL